MLHYETKVIGSTFFGLRDKVPLIIHQGGTSSGKTFGIMVALIMFARQSPDRLLITVAAVNFPYVRRDALRAFFEIVAAMGIKFTSKSFTNSTFQVGLCTFEFLGMEDPMKASHGKRDILFINEAYLIPYGVFNNLSIRTSRTAIIDYNPHEDFWLQDTVLKGLTRGEYIFKRTTYKDNPAVSEKVIKDIETLKETNPNLYRVYGLGLTGRLEGLVFPDVEYVDRFPDHCKRQGYGLDFGYANDPTACIRMGLYQGAVYLEEIIYETGLFARDICRLLIENQVTETDAIIADPADPRTIAEIKSQGFNIQPADGERAVNYGIDLLNSYPLKIVKSSNNLRKEQKSYRYKVDRHGKATNDPGDNYNHGWDAARYIGAKILSSGGVIKRRVKFAPLFRGKN